MVLDIGAIDGQQVAASQPVVEEAVSAAQHCLGLFILAVSIQGVGKCGARCPVVVVRDVILRLPAKAAGEREPRIELPVVLCE